MESRKKLVKSIRNAFRPFFKKVSPAAVAGKMLGLVYSKRSYLKHLGYIESVKTGRPCKKDGSPIPWMNYPIISFLEERLQKDLSLFEYGSGNSTLFYAHHVADVVSVECDNDWYNYIAKTMPENVKLILQHPYDSEKYLDIIKQQNKKFDVIIVDAEDRGNCLLAAPEFITEQGVIIVDDTQRGVNPATTQKILDMGFKKFDFKGLKPGAIREYWTTLFYREGNCLQL